MNPVYPFFPHWTPPPYPKSNFCHKRKKKSDEILPCTPSGSETSSQSCTDNQYVSHRLSPPPYPKSDEIIHCTDNAEEKAEEKAEECTVWDDMALPKRIFWSARTWCRHKQQKEKRYYSKWLPKYLLYPQYTDIERDLLAEKLRLRSKKY